METLNLIFEHGLHFAQSQPAKLKWHPHVKWLGVPFYLMGHFQGNTGMSVLCAVNPM